MRLSIIVAMADNGVIGRDGDLPWHISEDLKRFKRITMGAPILMGRKTYDSIGRPLPGRRSVVITRQPDWHADGVTAVPSLDAAIESCQDADEAFVIGGAEIYRLALPKADRLYMTRVHADVDGDVHLPDIDWSKWQLVEELPGAPDEKNPYRWTFETYDRLT
ncbi:MAG: dihydrofolate reductase [Pirellulales bacterium]|nr:dihydrofolate reductase [Pirellulales bacterium]